MASPKPKFDTERILESYQFSQDKGALVNGLLSQAGFDNNDHVFAFVGIGGTISSGYSPAQETIIPGSYKVSLNLLDDLKQKFSINQDLFTAIDLFSKDSRDIDDNDLVLLLDVLGTIKNKRIVITCGTYMLPIITSLLMRVEGFDDKTIGVTGGMLPNGFAFSDASMNILSAVTAVNYRALHQDILTDSVFAIFHGQVFDTLEAISNLDLHPSETDDLIVEYPVATIPSNRSKKSA